MEQNERDHLRLVFIQVWKFLFYFNLVLPLKVLAKTETKILGHRISRLTMSVPVLSENETCLSFFKNDNNKWEDNFQITEW